MLKCWCFQGKFKFFVSIISAILLLKGNYNDKLDAKAQKILNSYRLDQYDSFRRCGICNLGVVGSNPTRGSK